MPHPTKPEFFERRLDLDDLLAIAIALLVGVMVGWAANTGLLAWTGLRQLDRPVAAADSTTAWSARR